MEVQAPEEGTVSTGYSGNKRKRTVPTSGLSSETFAQPCDSKKMKVTPTLVVGNRNKHQEEEEEEEETLGNGSESQEKINLYCDSQSLSQSENEDGVHAPPSSPRHESQSQNSQSQSQELHLKVTRSPKRRPLTPQNSSANLNGMMLNRADSQGTKQLLSATRDVLTKRLKPNEKDKTSEDEKLSRTAVGYVHTPLTPDEKLLKPKKQTIQTVLSPEYWRKVCPKLHVQDKDFVLEAFSKFGSSYYEEEKEKRLNEWRDSMSENGYYETGVLEWGFKIKRLASAAATLRKLGWHPVWLVMFDEAWLMASCLAGIFRRTVNTKMDFNADFWAWYLDPMLEEKGWEVHRDRFNMPLAESAEPHYATAWVALTDATPKNGCMYAVPARFDPDYASLRESTDFDVQNLRALPAPAGGVLVWSGRTLHFGGRADKSAEVPRISISFAASTPAFEDPKMRFMFGDKKQDLLLTVNRETNEVNGESGKEEGGGRRYSFMGKETVSLPSLKTRMGIIATQLWTYQHRIPIPPHVKELLRALENQ